MQPAPRRRQRDSEKMPENCLTSPAHTIPSSILCFSAGAPTPYGTGGQVPHFYKWLGTGGTVSRRTANKKLIKLYWPSRKRSPERLIILYFKSPKSGGARPKEMFRRHCLAVWVHDYAKTAVTAGDVLYVSAVLLPRWFPKRFHVVTS